ncbi:hypothetical protein [Subtercola vilae]|uniref:hypothetical protein n=1 Tax=Subtercola vilae TaxID=2056433 RepID=UPI0010AA8728|nr:hypothetical protein [Subtercola vilae]
MPRYLFKSPFAQVFGDLHHGVNASVEGLEEFAYELHGVAVELHDGQFVTTDKPITHVSLTEVDGVGVVVTPPADAPEVSPEPPAPDGAEQNTEVQE